MTATIVSRNRADLSGSYIAELRIAGDVSHVRIRAAIGLTLDEAIEEIALIDVDDPQLIALIAIGVRLERPRSG